MALVTCRPVYGTPEDLRRQPACSSSHSEEGTDPERGSTRALLSMKVRRYTWEHLGSLVRAWSLCKGSGLSY